MPHCISKTQCCYWVTPLASPLVRGCKQSAQGVGKLGEGARIRDREAQIAAAGSGVNFEALVLFGRSGLAFGGKCRSRGEPRKPLRPSLEHRRPWIVRRALQVQADTAGVGGEKHPAARVLPETLDQGAALRRGHAAVKHDVVPAALGEPPPDQLVGADPLAEYHHFCIRRLEQLFQQNRELIGLAAVVGLLVEKPGVVAGHAHVLQRAGEPALLLGDVLKAQEAKPEELKAKQQRLLDSLRRDAGKAARSSLHGADTALRVRDRKSVV